MNRLAELQRVLANHNDAANLAAWENTVDDVKVARGLDLLAKDARDEGRAHGKQRKLQLGQIPTHVHAQYLEGFRETYTPAPRKKIGRPRKDAA